MKKWTRVWLYKRRRKDGKRSYSLRWLGEDGRIRTQACGTDKTTAETFRRHKESELNSPDYAEVQRIECSSFLDEFLQPARDHRQLPVIALADDRFCEILLPLRR